MEIGSPSSPRTPPAATHDGRVETQLLHELDELCEDGGPNLVTEDVFGSIEGEKSSSQRHLLIWKQHKLASVMPKLSRANY